MVILGIFPGSWLFCVHSQESDPHMLFREASFQAYRGGYDSAIVLFEEAAQTYLEAGDTGKAFLSRVRMADVMSQMGDLQSADSIITSLENDLFFTVSEERWLSSEVYQVKGNFLLLTGRLDSGRRCLERALDIKEGLTSGADTSFTYVLSKLGNYYYMVGNYDSALLLYSESLRLSKLKQDPVNFETALYYQSIGIAQTMRGFYAEAESSFLSALEISQRYLGEADPALARLYLNIGRFYYSIAKNEDAFEYYIKAQEVYHRTYSKRNINLAYVYWNIGNYFISKGDYIESINYLQQAHYIFAGILPEHDPRIRSLLMDLGVAHEKKGEFEEAIHYYRQSIIGNTTPSVIKSYRNLANAFRNAGKMKEAEESYLKAIETALQFSMEGEYDLALCYRYYGEFLTEELDDPLGLDYYGKALRLFRDLFQPGNEDISRILLLYGEYYLSHDRPDLALHYTDQALRDLGDESTLIEKSMDEEQYAPEYGLLLSEALDLKSRTLLRLYGITGLPEYLENCLNIIATAVNNLNGLRMSYSADESKLLLMKSAKKTLNTGIEAAYSLYELTGQRHYASKVFELSERSKSIVLLNTIRGLDALKMSNIPADMTKKEHRYKSDLMSYNSLIYKEKQKKSPDQEKIRLWQSLAFEIKKDYEELVGSFEREYPIFYRLKYDNSIITADSASALLQADQALLEYSKTDSAVYLSLITPGGVYCTRVEAANSVLLQALSDFSQMLRDNRMGNYTREDFDAYTGAAYFLYSHLILPFDSLIGKRRLILIPDEELSYLSFDALITALPSEDRSDFRDLDYLIRRQPLSYSPSGTFLFGLQKPGKSEVSSGLIAFAPSYSSDGSVSLLRGDEPGLDSLRLLPIKGVEEEVRRIMRIFPGKRYSGGKATEFNFKLHAGDYQVVHLAMHTLIDDVNPLFSKMVFTSGGAEGEDGFLNTYELYSMNLNGRLGVLSACNTGSGKLEHGEGVMSLARGFIYAGIPSLLMTLWEIEDQASSDIMSGFYENLRDGMPTDLALQQAKIRFLESAGKIKSHPSYWAGFVNIGEPVEITQRPYPRLNWWIFSLVLLPFVILVINRQVFRRKKKD